MNQIESQSLHLSQLVTNTESKEAKVEIIKTYLKDIELDSGYNLFLNFKKFDLDNKWINSPVLSNDATNGKVLLLDFFTYCCINCIHMFPYVHELEKSHAVEDGFAVIGVHSAKFPNEKASSNISDFLKQYKISHPVINDADAHVWNALEIKCWPTFMIIDPKGKVILSLPGEVHCETISLVIEQSLLYYQEKQMILTHSLPKVINEKVDDDDEKTKRFPSKVSMSPSGKLMAISYCGSNSIVVSSIPEGSIKFVVGSKVAGSKDGSFALCQFNLPQGSAWLNQDIFYVADCGNHLIRMVDLVNRKVSTVVGNGCCGSDKVGGKVGIEQEINSPWDLQIAPSPGSKDHNNNILYIAMAGNHQIWGYLLEDACWFRGVEYERGTCMRFAGSGNEENRNNSYSHKAGFAQPSGITYDVVNGKLYVADSESSTVRRVDIAKGSVEGIVGGGFDPTDLFAYGDSDGKYRNAKLQHPMAVVWDSVRSKLYVADTFNNKIKVVDPVEKTSATMRLGDESTVDNELNHPTGLCLNPTCDRLYVVDSNNHRVVSVRLLDDMTDDFRKLSLEEERGRLFTRPDQSSVLKYARDQIVVSSHTSLEGAVEWASVELSDGPSHWQVGLVKKAGGYAYVKGGEFSVMEDGGVRASWVVPVDSLVDEAELCLEAMLYVCEGGVCKLIKSLVTIPLKVDENLNSEVPAVKVQVSL